MAAGKLAPGFEGIDRAWLSDAFEMSHRFVFQRLDAKPEHKSKWYLALQHFKQSSVTVWPCLERVMEGGPVQFELDTGCTEPVLIPVAEALSVFIACPIVWRSWLWQYQNMPELRASLTPGVKLFRLGPPSSIFTLACRSAFWNLSRTLIVKWAMEEDIVCDSSMSLFEVLMYVLLEHLKLPESDVLDIVSKRLHIHDLASHFAPALLDLDEALEVLEKDDQRKVTEEQKSTVTHQKERSDFAACFRKKREEIRVAVAGPKAKAKAKVKGKGKGKEPPEPPFRWDSDISHADAKRLIPPGSSIWRGLTRREWCGHHEVSGAIRVRAPWDGLGGQQAALKNVVGRLWRQHLEHWGLPETDAPAGMFDDDAE